MNYKCVDTGGSWCPCRLAEVGACVQCRRLMGKKMELPKNGSDCNDCQWEGVCIYNQFLQDGKAALNVRKSRWVRIGQVKHYSEELLVLVLKVGIGTAQQATRPGSFIFCRRIGRDREFDVPLSVLYSDVAAGEIHIALNPCGPKTRDLVAGETPIQQEGVLFRGIYYSGLGGLDNLKTDDYGYRGNLVIAKGLAIAPLGQIIKYIGTKTTAIANGHIRMLLLLDSEKLTIDFIKDYYGYIRPNEIRNICLSDKEDVELSEAIIEEAKEAGWNIFLLVSPYYYDLLQGKKYSAVKPNYYNICCGEGICGACSYTDTEGRTVRNCKSAE